jgi:hypothetical protein
MTTSTDPSVIRDAAQILRSYLEEQRRLAAEMIGNLELVGNGYEQYSTKFHGQLNMLDRANGMLERHGQHIQDLAKTLDSRVAESSKQMQESSHRSLRSRTAR